MINELIEVAGKGERILWDEADDTIERPRHKAQVKAQSSTEHQCPVCDRYFDSAPSMEQHLQAKQDAAHVQFRNDQRSKVKMPDAGGHEIAKQVRPSPGRPSQQSAAHELLEPHLRQPGVNLKVIPGVFSGANESVQPGQPFWPSEIPAKEADDVTEEAPEEETEQMHAHKEWRTLQDAISEVDNQLKHGFLTEVRALERVKIHVARPLGAKFYPWEPHPHAC